MTALPGYHFHPSRYKPELGHTRLDVYLTDRSAGRFFDAESASFAVAEAARARRHTIHHPPLRRQDTWRVTVGRFEVRDRAGEVLDGLSLGGVLEVSLEGDYTHCHLASPAPIFGLRQDWEGAGEVLCAEFGLLLAERRAAWHGDDAGFERRLIQADPFSLFVASLYALKGRLDMAPEAARDPGQQELLDAIKRAIRILKRAGEWPGIVPTLGDLL